MTKFACLLRGSALALAVSSTAVHADAGKTRADAQVEYLTAAQAGELPSGFIARSTRDLYGNHAQSAGQSDPGPTQARIRADLFAAQRSGQIRTSFLGITQQELWSANFAPSNRSASASRASVRAELMAAQVANALPVGFAGRSLRALYPGSYPSAQTTGGNAQPGSHVSLNEGN